MRGARSAQIVLCGLTAALAMGPLAAAQSAQDAYYRAYYLEREEGDVEGAARLYERVADDGRAEPELRERARRALLACREDLTSADFTRLVPAETIAYVELSRPGDQLQSLLDQLGVLGAAGEAMREGGRRLAISPELVDEALGIRGAAVAVTGFDPKRGEPIGVAILHPGRVDVIRALIDTALPAGAEQVAAIEGHPTYNVEGRVYVTLTNRLIVASPYKSQIKRVLANLADGGAKSLATNPAMHEALAERGEELLYFCVNADPVKPFLRLALAAEAKNNPELAMVEALCDLESFQTLVGRAGVSPDGLHLDLSMTLADGHENLVFNFLRMPALDEGTLRRVPAGAAGFCAFSLNERRPVAQTGERAIVTGMDLGREVFGNLVSCAVFALPGPGAQGGLPVPDAAAVFTVNDPSKSGAIWNTMLGLASMATGRGAFEGDPVPVGGLTARSYQVQGGPTIFTAVSGDELVVATTRLALEASLSTSDGGRSVLQDPAFAVHLAGLHPGTTEVVMMHPGRCAEIARGLLGGGQAAGLEPYLGLLDDTVLSVAYVHSDRRLGLSTRLTGIPEVGHLVGQWIQGELGGAGGGFAGGPPPSRPAAATPDELAHLASALEGDAEGLDALARRLLTEEPYRGRFTELALEVSMSSNELTGFRDWKLVDTLALAEFERGNVEEAIGLAKHALELVGDDPRRAEVEERLTRFQSAREGATVGVGG